MLRLLNIEFHKLKHNRASKVLTIIYFILLTSIALVATIKFPFGNRVALAELGIFDFPYIWHLNTYMASWFKLFLLLVIVSMMANEYTNRTLKQNLIDGLSKKEFILSKFYTVIVFAAISTIFVFVVSLILGYIYSNFNEPSIVFSDLEYIFAFFLKLVAFFSFGLFMGILVKRSAFAVGGILVWFLIEGVTKLLLFWRFDEDPITSPKTAAILKYFPLESMSNLIKEPFTSFRVAKSLAQEMGQDLSKNTDVLISDVIIVSIWTFIFIYLSYRLLKKRDL